MEDSVDISEPNSKNAAEENSKGEDSRNDEDDPVPAEQKRLEDKPDNSGRKLNLLCSSLTIRTINFIHR